MAGAVVLLVLFGASIALADKLPEPQPWPDTAVPANSDYQEAQALLSKHQWAEAAIVFRSLLNRDPRSDAFAVGLSRALTYSGRREEALGVLNDAISRQKSGRKTQPLIRRLRVISRLFLTNTTFQTYQDGVNLLRFRKYKPARERFEKALTQEPDNVEILVRIGQCLILENDNDSAAERLKLARKLNPFEPELHLWLGRALHQRGELVDAISELKSARADLRDSELAPVWYADALYAAGQRQAAVQALEEDVKAHPLHVSALFTLSEFRLAVAPRDRHENALWAIRQELQLALSRITEYQAPNAPRFESELGIELRKPEADLKADLTKLLQKVDSQLESDHSDSPDAKDS